MLPPRNQNPAPRRKPVPKPFERARNISSICIIIFIIANLFIQTGYSSVNCTFGLDGETQSCNRGMVAGKCAASALGMTRTSNSVVLTVECPWGSTVSGVTYLSYLLTLITCILFLPCVSIKSPTFLLVSGILSTILLVVGCSLMVSDIIEGHNYYTKSGFKNYTFNQTWYIVTAVFVGIITLAALGQAILGYKLYSLNNNGGPGAVISSTAAGGVTIGGNDKNAKERYMRMN